MFTSCVHGEDSGCPDADGGVSRNRPSSNTSHTAASRVAIPDALGVDGDAGLRARRPRRLGNTTSVVEGVVGPTMSHHYM